MEALTYRLFNNVTAKLLQYFKAEVVTCTKYRHSVLFINLVFKMKYFGKATDGLRRYVFVVRYGLTGPREVGYGEHCKSETVQQKWYIILFNTEKQMKARI